MCIFIDIPPPLFIKNYQLTLFKVCHFLAKKSTKNDMANTIKIDCGIIKILLYFARYAWCKLLQKK